MTVYSISYMWYALIGVIVVCSIGSLVSWITGEGQSHRTFLGSASIRRFYQTLDRILLLMLALT